MLEKDGSLKVTENFKVEGLEDVYAIGDIARFHYPVTDETLRIEHWVNNYKFIVFRHL